MAREERHFDPVTTTAAEVADHLARLCPEYRIDLAGAVTLPAPLPHEEKWRSFQVEERHADLDYLTRDPEGRLDPTGANPWARSLLVFAQRYTDGWAADDTAPVSGGPPGGPETTPWTDRVSRYARGLDYHDVFLKDIKKVVAGLQDVWPDLATFPVTDTGPYLEREYAWLAGLGFLGKNTCLIHEKLGSGLFLGVAPTNLVINGLPTAGIPSGEPLFGAVPRRRHQTTKVAASHCGTCTSCIEACPTGALLPEGGMNAGNCISTWTIEWRGGTPAGRETEQGGILFGCDICQAVCPWNHRASANRPNGGVREEFTTRPDHSEISLADLLKLTDDDFKARFRRTPIWRCHPEGLRANAKVVLDNLTKGEDS